MCFVCKPGEVSGTKAPPQRKQTKDPRINKDGALLRHNSDIRKNMKTNWPEEPRVSPRPVSLCISAFVREFPCGLEGGYEPPVNPLGPIHSGHKLHANRQANGLG